MKYLLQIIGPVDEPPASHEDDERHMAAWGVFHKALVDAGIEFTGVELAGVATATTVKVLDDGTATVTDGPFAEAREALGGFYVVDVPDLDAAIDWARRCPGASGGWSVEVRPFHTS